MALNGDLLAALDAKDRRAMTDPDGYFAALPASFSAQAAALLALADHLASQFPETYARIGPQIDIVPAFRRVRLDDPLMPPLLLAAGLIAGDLLLLQPVDNIWRVTAGALATGDRMIERLGAPAPIDARILDTLPAATPVTIDGTTLLRPTQSDAVLITLPAPG